MDKLLDVFELYACSDENTVEKFNKKIDSMMNVRIEKVKPKAQFLWVAKMEDTIQYLDNILRTPTKLIINEEEVVKIEKIKKVTVESVKNLAKNSAYIDKIDEMGEVKPGKLLNVFKEETLNTYENRFLYTLIQKMLIIIRKEKSKLIKELAIDKEFKKFDYEGKSSFAKSKVEIKLSIAASTMGDEKHSESKIILDRVKALEKEVINLTLSQTYQIFEKEHMLLINPPLKKNNVLLKNVNFQYAVKLWDYLITEMEKEELSKPETKVKEYKDRGKAKRLVDETFLLDYLILDCVENPEINDIHKNELIERLIANVVEKTIDVDKSLSEEQLQNLVSKQFKIIKYKNTTSNKGIQDIFKSHIEKYIQKINRFESEK